MNATLFSHIIAFIRHKYDAIRIQALVNAVINTYVSETVELSLEFRLDPLLATGREWSVDACHCYHYAIRPTIAQLKATHSNMCCCSIAERIDCLGDTRDACYMVNSPKVPEQPQQQVR